MSSRCFVHIANSRTWRSITGEAPPTIAPTAEVYTRAGLPWFEWYGETGGVEAGAALTRMRSVRRLGEEKGETPLPENASVDPVRGIGLRPGRRRTHVRESVF